VNGARSLLDTLMINGVDVCFANPGSPIVNMIGDHATYHRHYDAPLTSDIEGTARPFSHWVRTSPTADTVAEDAAAAVAAGSGSPLRPRKAASKQLVAVGRLRYQASSRKAARTSAGSARYMKSGLT